MHHGAVKPEILRAVSPRHLMVYGEAIQQVPGPHSHHNKETLSYLIDVAKEATNVGFEGKT